MEKRNFITIDDDGMIYGIDGELVNPSAPTTDDAVSETADMLLDIIAPGSNAGTGDPTARAMMIRAVVDVAVAGLTDAQALEVPELYRPWMIGETVKVNDVRKVGDALYRCKQGHTTQANWTPAATPALWTRIVPPDTWIAWSAGSWELGAKVTHKGKKWVSQVPNNTWEPGSPGVYDNIWKEYVS